MTCASTAQEGRTLPLAPLAPPTSHPYLVVSSCLRPTPGLPTTSRFSVLLSTYLLHPPIASSTHLCFADSLRSLLASPAAAAPPAFTALSYSPARFIWQVEEGGSSAKRWTPLPRKVRRDGDSWPAARRRPVEL